MNVSFLQVLIFLIIGIGTIILFTTRFKVPAFFALLIACFIVGLGVHLPVLDIITTIKDGFGAILKSLGLLIILGTTLGLLLEHTGSTRTMATYILKKVGEQNAPLAMSLTGFIVGLPIFCDSGYIVLSGLNNSIARRTGIPVTVMAVTMASGLYSVHCLIPPHPGAAAAAGTLGVDVGRLIVWGIVAAIPAMLAGYAWALYAGKRELVVNKEPARFEEAASGPPVLNSFLPILVPIALIALKSFFTIDPLKSTRLLNVLSILGDPVIALSAGIILAFFCKRGWHKNEVSTLLQEGIEKAGGILVIIGAGGAFGAILAATKIGQHISTFTALEGMGLLFPFLLTFILKTAQGSSTVAIITAASIVQPLLPALGLASDTGRLLSVLAMGAGSMMISHANDAYFWVITKFSGLEMKSMLKVYSVATILMGIITLAIATFFIAGTAPVYEF